MKRFTLLLLIAVTVLISCNSKNSYNHVLLTAQNLKSAFIFLNADSAYNLKMPKGAILKIAKNSFDVKGDEKIKLEIKEAYSAKDILLAGLTTKSNGRLLQSGGMIYINATANDKAVNMIKPINVTIPSAVYNDSMQLFKGNIKDDGSINWIDPQPLDTTPAAKNIMLGAALFKANCASCHKPTMDFTAPPLAGCRERQPYSDWAYRFTKNPTLMIEKDAYAKALYNKWNKTQMTAFVSLKQTEVDAILDYCDNELRLNRGKLPSAFITDSLGSQPPAANPCFDSGFYPLPDTNIQVLPIDTMPDSTGIITSGAEPTEVPMYQFNIDQSGWYNIDCFIDNNKALVTNVSLTVTLKMPKKLNVEVYLCIPGRKLFTSGIEMENGVYQFYNDDSTIPLILNDEAMIFAFGADTTVAMYGISKFKVQNKQHITVNLKVSTKEDILSAIKSNMLDGVKIEKDKPVTFIRRFSMSDSTTSDTSKQEMQMRIFEIPCNSINPVNVISQLKK